MTLADNRARRRAVDNCHLGERCALAEALARSAHSSRTTQSGSSGIWINSRPTEAVDRGAAQSWDRRRIAIATSRGKLFVREADRILEHSWFKCWATPFAIGFNSDNKAWILDWLALASYDFEERPVPPGTIAPTTLFEEVVATP